jgi:hypothetical protein
MKSHRFEDAAGEVLTLGGEGFDSPATETFIRDLYYRYPARNVYVDATITAMARTGVPYPREQARLVFRNFLWTHFVCKLLMTGCPQDALEFALENVQTDEVTSSLDRDGPGILSCFHYNGYPLVALSLAVSPARPLISKARIDEMEGGRPDGMKDHVAYVSDRSFAVRVTRSLRSGRSVWLLLDVVLPSVRVVDAEFGGTRMRVGAGLGTIAMLSGRSCIPVSWRFRATGTKCQLGGRISPAGLAEDAFVQMAVSAQARIVTEQPAEWLEWYSILGEAPTIRQQVKAANEKVWAELLPIVSAVGRRDQRIRPALPGVKPS